MHNSFPSGGFFGNNMDGMWQAVEELRYDLKSLLAPARVEARCALRSWRCSQSSPCTATRSSMKSRSVRRQLEA